jgi:hypothetical protein
MFIYSYCNILYSYRYVRSILCILFQCVVLCVVLCVNVYRLPTQLQLTNISYHIISYNITIVFRDLVRTAL